MSPVISLVIFGVICLVLALIVVPVPERTVSERTGAKVSNPSKCSHRYLY